MATEEKTREVTLDLQETEENRNLIEAIEEDNEDISVTHMPGLVKLAAPKEILIRRETVEGKLGREWETPEFQMAIVTYAGNFAEWDDDHIVIRWDH